MTSALLGNVLGLIGVLLAIDGLVYAVRSSKDSTKRIEHTLGVLSNGLEALARGESVEFSRDAQTGNVLGKIVWLHPAPARGTCSASARPMVEHVDAEDGSTNG